MVITIFINISIFLISMKKALPLTLTALALAGCSENKLRTVERDEYNSQNASIRVYLGNEGKSLNTTPSQDWFIQDFNGDGLADSIYRAGFHLYVAPEIAETVGVRAYDFIMTPEIQQAATKALNADHDLSLLINNDIYRKVNK